MLKLEGLRGALSFRGKKSFQEKTESELVIFLEMQEWLEFTQFNVLFSFVGAQQKGKGK